MQTPAALDLAYVTPIYSQGEAARIIQAPPSSFTRWAHGHRFRQRHEGEWGHSAPLLTGVREGRGVTVPFTALAEGYIIESFRRAGLPMARIRPAIDVLRDRIGLENALLSQRLMTDGAEILFENGEGDLVVVRNQQGVFREVVHEFLRSISYRDGYVSLITLPTFEGVDVVVDPLRNAGQPTIARLGVRVEDVLSRVRAGEPLAEVGDDFGLERRELRSLIIQAA
ncbi:DUF433 domain-containing protein [Rathayibacter sp. VKM Ac-2803]|uniref:DUF433 domain-containing protein n=1 Tax=unclassified Rathayibacter TaxID=2609250 RepID=UPI00135AF077|nr:MULTISPECIES: DUF433 domain-containing protein [unclassified Rathayibacter]MWV48169.1 DUF433 domain-containing protein [Rathayibacter sp. VKM Ac-2803]MWV59338.1 DUF433 domain-containing protein [Rathayibacter sp. VKM Ac-2754]